MILPLFIFLTCFSLVLIFLGSFTDVPVYQILGFFLLFLLGIYLINSDITYVSGEDTDYVYDNSTGTYLVNETSLNYTYSNWTDNKTTTGIYLAIASIMGLITMISLLRVGDIKRD